MDLRQALFSEMAMVQVGLLGVQGAALPLQPMVHLRVARVPELWFLAEPDSDLVKGIEAAEDEDGGATAVYGFTGRTHDLHACLTGPVRLAPDRRGLEQVWSIMAEALFPAGLTDIEWMPLRMRLTEAVVWASPESAVVKGMEVVPPPLLAAGLVQAVRQVIRF